MTNHQLKFSVPISQQYEFSKVRIGESNEEKSQLCKKLSKYGISIAEYGEAFSQREIKLITVLYVPPY